MKFTEILENLKKGEKVTRERWKKPDCNIDFIVHDQNKGKCVFYRDGECYDEFVWVYEDIIAEDWELYKEKKTNKNWKPKEGDTIFYITETGRVISGTFLSLLPSDNAKVLFNNAFQTREEAEHMFEKIKIINQLRGLSNIKFSENKGKYFIYYNFRENRVLCGETNFCKLSPFEACFKTAEECQEAIETIGEENLKKYYFDVEEK